MKTGVRILAISLDNANVMKAMSNLLKKEIPGILVLPCSAHTLNLCCKKILSTEYFSETVDKVDQIVQLLAKQKNKHLRV